MALQDLKDAVDEFFSDTSRSPEETREGLEDIREHAQMLIESIPD